METEQKAAAPAVVRAARVLDLLAGSDSPVSLATLARELQLPKSSLHGLCATLIDLRLLIRIDNGDMMLGPHVMNWANAFLANSDDIVQAFYGALAEMKIFSEETITLAVADGANVVYVTSRKGSRPLGLAFRVGMRLPAPFTATGKAILATQSDAFLKDMFANGWPQPLTAASTKNFKQLRTQLDGIRAQGYSIDDGEIREGLFCVGAPIFDAGNKHAVAGVAVSFMYRELDEAGRQASGEAMRTLADRISERLGAMPRAYTKNST